MQKQLLVAELVLFSCLLPLKASAATVSKLAHPFDNIYVFGDSLSDTGNVYNLTKDYQNRLHIPIVPQDPPYYKGRFSNGLNWVDYLAKDLNLSLQPGVNNFAYGGAESGSDNIESVPGLPKLPGLSTEIDTYLTSSNHQADPNAVYTVWVAGNDLLQTNPTPPQTVVNNILSAVNSLTTAGARHIIVPNQFDLGKTPEVNGTTPQADGYFNDLTATLNSGLSTALQQFGQNHPDVQIDYLNVDQIFNDAIDGKYGFKNVTDSCLKPLGSPVIGPFTECPKKEQDKYWFWDGLHITTAAHKVIADAAYSQLIDPPADPVPEPSENWGIMVLGALGIGYLIKRKHKKS